MRLSLDNRENAPTVQRNRFLTIMKEIFEC